MIIVKSPFRITCGGGSVDFPSYFTEFGPVISTGFGFSKYCYVSLMHLPNINGVNYQIAYSSFERVKKISEIKNNGVRGTLEYLSNKLNNSFDKIGINIINEMNPRTGIGSSSSMICALTQALYTYLGLNLTKKELAQIVIEIERFHLKEAGGWNDQIFTSFSNFNSITYDNSGFIVRPLSISSDFKDYLLKSCVLYYTSENNTRNSYEIAQSYENKDSLEYKHKIASLSVRIKEELERENLENFGRLIHKSWEQKKKISKLISNSRIDETYDKILSSGALGGRIMGSGEAGFIFTVYPSPEEKIEAVKNINIPYIDVDLDTQGTQVIFNGD